MRTTRLSALGYNQYFRPGCESSDLDSQTLIHLHHHCSLSGQCGYTTEGWKIAESSGNGGNVGSVWIFQRKRQLIEGFLGEEDHYTYLKVEEKTVGENLSVRIRSQRRHGVVG